MDNTTALISIYQRGFQTCLIITILAAALTVFLFIRFDIRHIVAVKTGRTQRRRTRKNSGERDQRTGRFRRQTKIERDATEKTKESTLKISRTDRSEKADETVDMRSDETVNMHYDETMDISASSDAGESASTEKLAPHDSVPPDNTVNTEFLSEAARSGPASGSRFDITEYTVIVHTEEIIE